MATLPCRHVSIAIERPFDEVYRFLSDPTQLASWASGLTSGPLEADGARWRVDSPVGPVYVRFAPQNPFGVVDHELEVEPGLSVQIVLRVLRNADGAEVVLSLFQEPGVSPEKFEADVRWVERDLRALKTLLEDPTPAQ